MTAGEFEREFDILYNNIASNAAPSIDLYEKSVFLTKAQEELVGALYNTSFETNEATTEHLANLVTTKKYDSEIDALTTIITEDALSENSTFFELPSNLLYITYEALKMKEPDDCGNYATVLVKPTTQDEYYRVSKNPFRQARKRCALRLTLDYGEDSNIHAVEIVSTQKKFTYIMRYLRKPRPIVLYNEEGLTVDGVDAETVCELNPILHRQILDRAVLLAIAAYKPVAQQTK